MHRAERIVVALMLLSLVAAWFIGARTEQADLGPTLLQALPSAKSFKAITPDLYEGAKTQDGPVQGYVALGQASGYGGPLRLAIGVDAQGRIENVVVFDHKESAPFFRRVQDRNITSTLTGKICNDPPSLGKDIDAVSGATLSSGAIINATRAAARQIAGKVLRLPLRPEQKASIVFGWAEIFVLVLVIAAQGGLVTRFKYAKHLRWLTLLGGLLIIGFLLATPLTLANINSSLMGYWPDWRVRLGFYFILAAVYMPVILKGSNTYCTHLCPFGAAQECIGLVGGAKNRALPGRLNALGRWLPRILAWGFILAALLQRKPGIVSHEVFGVIFERTGTAYQAILLAAILILALFVNRPWCRYLCSIRPTVELVQYLRRYLTARS